MLDKTDFPQPGDVDLDRVVDAIIATPPEKLRDAAQRLMTFLQENAHLFDAPMLLGILPQPFQPDAPENLGPVDPDEVIDLRKERFSLMIAGAEHSRHPTCGAAVVAGEKAAPDFAVRCVIQDLAPRGLPGERVPTIMERDSAGIWLETHAQKF